jgi:3-methylfumaryl-CoA hydratase
MSIDIEHLRTWIGRVHEVEDSLCEFPARALGAILDHDRRLSAGDALPAAWHWLYFLDATKRSMIGPDGHPKKGDFLPPIPLPRRMWAAGSMKIHRPLRLGRLSSKRSSVRSVDHKTGKSGDLVFVILDHEVSQAGDVCIREEQTLVYRAMPTERAPLSAGERSRAAADWSATFRADGVDLFRYSALTFNSHRIHYDRDYAMGEEFYPGLVVHAPLLVTLLLNLLHLEMAGAPVAALEFRAARPTFDSSPVHLHGARDGRHVNLWTADAEDFIGVSARAELGQLS